MSSNNPSRICVSVCASSWHELQKQLAQAAAEGDLIEIRLDCLESLQPDEVIKKLPTLIETIDRPVIITLRPPEQGGHLALDLQSRRRFFELLETNPAVLLDLELDLARDFMSRPTEHEFPWERVVCSHHEFADNSVNPASIYERLVATPAEILKIAIKTDDLIDCLPVFSLLERARRESRKLIAIGMGYSGMATRILGPSRGSYLTYAGLSAEKTTAPGQPSVTELRNVFRIHKIDRGTAVMGLIGNPVSHSFSPRIHNSAFEYTDINAVFIPFEVRNLDGFMNRMVHHRTRELEWNLQGLSVTAPHKTAVMQFLDWVTPEAKAIGAVNTIVARGDAWHGFNTDVVGFTNSLVDIMGALGGLSCAVVGSGGAARAIIWALRNLGAITTVYSRSESKGKALAEEFAATWSSLDRAMFGSYDVVINATPLGTRGSLEHQSVARSKQLRGARLVYDLVYNPEETALLREAHDAGCATLGGLSMLVTQAAAQFKLWTGTNPPEDVMRKAVQEAMQNV